MLNMKQRERLVEMYYEWLGKDSEPYDFSRFLKVITFLSIHGLFNEDKAKSFVAAADKNNGSNYPTCLNTLSPVERERRLLGKWNLPKEDDHE